MKNRYLEIDIQEDGKIKLLTSDGVLIYRTTFNTKEEFLKYCDEEADMWLNSTCSNFEGLSKKHRKSIAHKWIIAKNKPEGRYDYYFNFGSKEDIFRKEVEELAKNMGIENYKLTVE